MAAGTSALASFLPEADPRPAPDVPVEPSEPIGVSVGAGPWLFRLRQKVRRVGEDHYEVQNTSASLLHTDAFGTTVLVTYACPVPAFPGAPRIMWDGLNDLLGFNRRQTPVASPEAFAAADFLAAHLVGGALPDLRRLAETDVTAKMLSAAAARRGVKLDLRG